MSLTFCADFVNTTGWMLLHHVSLVHMKHIQSLWEGKFLETCVVRLSETQHPETQFPKAFAFLPIIPQQEDNIHSVHRCCHKVSRSPMRNNACWHQSHVLLSLSHLKKNRTSCNQVTWPCIILTAFLPILKGIVPSSSKWKASLYSKADKGLSLCSLCKFSVCHPPFFKPSMKLLV